MTANELKARPDYKFEVNGLEFLIPEIRRGAFNQFYPEYGRFELGVTTLEVGYLALDVNVTSCESNEDGDYTNKPVVSYFLCVKGNYGKSNEYWGDGGYMDDVGFETEVDFNRDNWKEQLEEDMVNKLIKIAETYSLKSDSPNFTRDDYFRIFDKIHNPDQRYGVFCKASSAVQFLRSFGTEKEAEDYCESHEWRHIDYNGFEWSLCIDERW